MGTLPSVMSGCAEPKPALLPSLSAGEPTPPVELLTLAREPRRLDETVRGKAALISVWATWCEACEEEFPALNRLYERAQPEGGMVLGVAVGEPGSTVAEFARSKGLAYPQLVDEDFKLADTLAGRRV